MFNMQTEARVRAGIRDVTLPAWRQQSLLRTWLVETRPLWSQEHKNYKIARKTVKRKGITWRKKGCWTGKHTEREEPGDRSQHVFFLIHSGSPKSLSHQSQDSRVLLSLWWSDREWAGNEMCLSTVIPTPGHQKQSVVCSLRVKELMGWGMKGTDLNLCRLHRS